MLLHGLVVTFVFDGIGNGFALLVPLGCAWPVSVADKASKTPANIFLMFSISGFISKVKRNI
jgi:hypothetical protein